MNNVAECLTVSDNLITLGSLSPRNLRYSQDHAWRRPDQARAAVGGFSGKPRRRPGLGLRARVRRGYVAHAAGRQARGLRAGHRPGHYRPGVRDDGFRARRIWREHVRVDHRYDRPTEVDALIGDASKAHRELGWKSQTMAAELAQLMVDADIELL